MNLSVNGSIDKIRTIMMQPLPKSPTVEFATLQTKPSHTPLWVIFQMLTLAIFKPLNLIFNLFKVN